MARLETLPDPCTLGPLTAAVRAKLRRRAEDAGDAELAVRGKPTLVTVGARL